MYASYSIIVIIRELFQLIKRLIKALDKAIKDF